MTNGALILIPNEPPQVGCVNLELPIETHELQVWVAYDDDDGSHEERLPVQLS
jgi:hypothetical protein